MTFRLFYTQSQFLLFVDFIYANYENGNRNTLACTGYVVLLLVLRHAYQSLRYFPPSLFLCGNYVYAVTQVLHITRWPACFLVNLIQHFFQNPSESCSDPV